MLTFDKIRDLERVERQSKKLQKLPDDIAVQLKDYLRRKEKITEKTSTDMIEVENIKTTIKRFFELREGKIVSAVLDTVRTGLPAENMSKDEEKLFYKLTDILKQYRETFFSELNRKEEEKPMYLVKKATPQFVGPDMKSYKLNESDIVSIPAPLDELLLKEGIIEKVEK
ncbi:MAG: hypothetical protein WC613_01265 [Candidatus Aenigmatarchaeota archaeon]